MALEKGTLLMGGFKYVYIIIFFMFLAGFFHPLVTNTSFDIVVIGVLVLLLGLAGGILLYRSATDGGSGRKGAMLGAGFALMAISTLGIYYMTGRV
ncbi:MAG: hypothetical protein J4F28_04305 [Nitrosopumilaceae archaeon]|nr:hypothetical protein [Nitrosopumilaceae archaeon]